MIRIAISGNPPTTSLSTFPLQTQPTLDRVSPFEPLRFAMMDESNMNHHNTPMSTANMPMTFFTSTTTPLYTSAWTPKTPAQYAMTCLFLVLLCVVFRGLLAARGNMPWLLAFVSPKKGTPEEVSCCAEEDGLQKTFRGELAADSHGNPSKVWEVLLRALLDTSLAIFSYLL